MLVLLVMAVVVVVAIDYAWGDGTEVMPSMKAKTTDVVVARMPH